MDRESRKFFKRREPGQRAHRSGVRTVKVGGKLFLKVIKRIEGMGFIETPLVFTMTAFNFAVVPGRVRADKFVPDPQLGGCLLKQCRFVSGCCEPVGELTSIIRLYTSAFTPLRLNQAAAFFRKSAEE